MNAQRLIKAIQANDDLQSIASQESISLQYLKQILIEVINQSPKLIVPEAVQETDSDSCDESEVDNEIFNRIIKDSPVKFSEEQLEFMNLAVNKRENLALLAPAGYGKSAVIETTVELFKKIVRPYDNKWIREHYGKSANTAAYQDFPHVGLCASTGKAASLIKGRTLHSYLGIGLGRGSVDDWVKRVSTSRFLKNTFYTLRMVQVIIIDEVSMVSSKLLDDISEYLQRIRCCNDPFGGVQMIFVGDLAQLKPVQGTFVFKSMEYQAANVQTFRLTKCFRQKDPAFQDILNQIRYGNCPSDAYRVLAKRTAIDEEYSRGMKPMRLMSTNSEVDELNIKELHATCEEYGVEIISFPVNILTEPKKSELCMKADGIPNVVDLAIGAQVVVTQNLSPTLVNGTQGKIIDITKEEVVIECLDAKIVTVGYIGFKDPDAYDVYSPDAKVLFQYVPLRLGYACTIHKAQGMTLSLLEVDLKRVFTHGQGYVAISRVTDLQGLVIKNLSKKAFICDAAVKEFYGVA